MDVILFGIVAFFYILLGELFHRALVNELKKYPQMQGVKLHRVIVVLTWLPFIMMAIGEAFQQARAKKLAKKLKK